MILTQNEYDTTIYCATAFQGIKETAYIVKGSAVDVIDDVAQTRKRLMYTMITGNVVVWGISTLVDSESAFAPLYGGAILALSIAMILIIFFNNEEALVKKHPNFISPVLSEQGTEINREQRDEIASTFAEIAR